MQTQEVQIHHIDEYPTNHSIDNLAVLCLEHHAQAHSRGGFGQKLKAANIVCYRDNWIKRVATQRERTDELIVQFAAGKKNFASGFAVDEGASANQWSPPTNETIIGFLHALPHLRRAALVAAQSRWNTGIRSELVQGSYDAIEVLERAWIRLAAFYPPKHFGERPAHHFFSDFLASRFTWYRNIYEPLGPGSAGTMLNEIVCSGVLDDVAAAIDKTAEGLYVGFYLSKFDLLTWRRDWTAAGNISATRAYEAAE